MILTHEKLKETVKRDLLKILKEEKAHSIEMLVYDIMDANSQGNQKKAEKLYGLLFPRLSSMGFDRNTLMKMRNEIKNITDDRDAQKFIARYKLSDEYIASHRVRTYKMIITIPFATSKNKEEKEKELKYNLVMNNIKILGVKELAVAELGNAGTMGKALDLKYLIKVKTMLKPSDIENNLQPEYVVDKIKEQGIGEISKKK